MSKLKHLTYDDKRAIKKGIHNQKRKKKRRCKNRGCFGRGREKHNIKLKIITMPEILSLYTKENSKEILSNLIPNDFKDNEKIIMNFNSTHTITLSGGIFLYGILQLLRERGIAYHLKRNQAKSKIKQILEYITAKKHEQEISYEDIKCWKIHTFNEKIDCNNRTQIAKHIKDTLEIKGKKSKISDRAIIEILSNCNDHAYVEKDDDYKKFYLFSGIAPQESGKKSQYTFCIFDHGRGLKQSFLSHNQNKGMNMIEKFKELTNSEGKIINEIITKHKSGTKGKERGKGLSTTLDDVVETAEGKMLIYSHKGYFEKESPKSSPILENRTELKGTLVQFSIPLDC